MGSTQEFEDGGEAINEVRVEDEVVEKCEMSEIEV